MKISPFRIERYFASREFTAPYLLCASDCQSYTIGELLALENGAAEAFQETWLGYTETNGSPGLRSGIAGLYSSLKADDIVVHAGGEEVIFTFMNAALEAGDHVVVHHPSYQSLSEIPRALGCDVSFWETHPEKGWALELDVLAGLLRDTTRLVIVNQPHSPTGFLWSRGEWHEFLELMKSRDILVFSDEAYRCLEYDAADRLPSAADVYENAACLGLLSKGFGLPGLRIGWLASRHQSLLEQVRELKDYTTICGAAPSEFLGELALRHGDRLLERSHGIVAANLELLRSFFARHEERLAWVPPKAGPVTFPTLRRENDIEAFCAEVLEASGVLLLPGKVFRQDSREIRIGMGRADMQEALERFDTFLESR